MYPIRPLLLLSFLAATSSLAPRAFALDGTWDKTKASGSWTSSGNWLGSQPANGAGYIATFEAADSSTIQTTLNSARTIGGITVTGVTSTTNRIILTGANILTLQGSSTPVFNIGGTADAGLDLNTNIVLAGTQGFEKTGSGLLTITGANHTFTGEVVLTQGAIRSYVANALGSRTIRINGADTAWRVEAGEHASNLILHAGDATVSGVGPAEGTGTADSLLTGQISETPGQARGVTYYNSVSGANRVKRFIVSGNNSYTGDTTLGRNAQSETIVRITHGNAFGTGEANVTLLAGSTHDANTLELSNNITVVGKTLTLAGRGQGQAGSLQSMDGENTWSGTVELGTTETPTIGVATGSRLTLSGTVTGAATGNGFTKTGGGALLLTGQSDYTGATTVEAGRLEVDGALTGGGSVTVASGATLGGGGSISGSVQVAGTLAAGNSIGTFATGSLTLQSTGTLAVELGLSGGSAVADRVAVSGGVSLFSGANLSLTLGSGLDAPVEGDTFWLLSNDGGDAVSGFFTQLNGTDTALHEGSLFSWNAQLWSITYQADFDTLSLGGGNDIALIAVPEPQLAAWAGLVGLAALLRRRKTRA